MEYIKEDQILLYEELYSKAFDRDDPINRATIRFRENIRLANYIASKFSEPHDNALSKEDIIQEAYVGLWRACLNFDESKGFEFSTYALPMIRGKILLMLRNNGALKEPRKFKDIRAALLRHGFELPLNEYELDVLISEGVASRKQLLSYVNIEYVHLDAPLLGKEGTKGGTFADVIPDQSIADIGMELDEDEIEEAIDKVLKYIKQDHKDLVEEWMYAALEGIKLNQITLAKKYNISQAHVSRVLNSAISIIKMYGDEIREIFGL